MITYLHFKFHVQEDKLEHRALLNVKSKYRNPLNLSQYFTIYLPIIVRIQHFNNFILHIHNTMPGLFHTITNGLCLGDPLQEMSKNGY